MTKEELEYLIFEKKLSYEKIGKLFNVSGTAIKKRAKKLGIKLPIKRTTNENETFNKNITLIDKINDENLKKIVNESKSMVDLSKTSPDLIVYILFKHEYKTSKMTSTFLSV